MEKHYRRKEVQALTGLSRSTIYDQMSRGLFPRPIKLTGRAVAWPESSLSAWLEARSTQTAAVPARAA